MEYLGRRSFPAAQHGEIFTGGRRRLGSASRKEAAALEGKFWQPDGVDVVLLRVEPPPVAKCCLYSNTLSVPGGGSARDK